MNPSSFLQYKSMQSLFLHKTSPPSPRERDDDVELRVHFICIDAEIIGLEIGIAQK